MIWKIANKPNNFYILMKSTKDDYKLYDPTGKSLTVTADDPLELDIREFLFNKLEIEVTKAKGGREKVYEDKTITIIHYENSEEGAKALSEDAKPTPWCSKDYDYALHHVTTNFHIVFEDDIPYIAYQYPENHLRLWFTEDGIYTVSTKDNIPITLSAQYKAIMLLQRLGIKGADEFNTIFSKLINNPNMIITEEYKEQLEQIDGAYIIQLLRANPKLTEKLAETLDNFDKKIETANPNYIIDIINNDPDSIEYFSKNIEKFNYSDIKRLLENDIMLIPYIENKHLDEVVLTMIGHDHTLAENIEPWVEGSLDAEGLSYLLTTWPLSVCIEWDDIFTEELSELSERQLVEIINTKRARNKDNIINYFKERSEYLNPKTRALIEQYPSKQ